MSDVQATLFVTIYWLVKGIVLIWHNQTAATNSHNSLKSLLAQHSFDEEVTKGKLTSLTGEASVSRWAETTEGVCKILTGSSVHTRRNTSTLVGTLVHI